MYKEPKTATLKHRNPNISKSANLLNQNKRKSQKSQCIKNRQEFLMDRRQRNCVAARKARQKRKKEADEIELEKKKQENPKK